MCTVATIKFRSNLSVPYKIYLLGGKYEKEGSGIKRNDQPSPPPKYGTPIKTTICGIYVVTSTTICSNSENVAQFFHTIGNICYMYIYQIPNWSKHAIAKPKHGWGYILVPPKHLQCKLQIHPRGAYTSITPSANATPPILLEHTTKCGG